MQLGFNLAHSENWSELIAPQTVLLGARLTGTELSCKSRAWRPMG